MAKLIASTIKVDKLLSSGKDHGEGQEKKEGRDPYISMKLRGIHRRVFTILPGICRHIPDSLY